MSPLRVGPEAKAIGWVNWSGLATLLRQAGAGFKSVLGRLEHGIPGLSLVRPSNFVGTADELFDVG